MTETLFFPASKRLLDQSSSYREFIINGFVNEPGYNSAFPSFQKIFNLTLAAHFSKVVEFNSTDQLIIIPTVGRLQIKSDALEFQLDAGQCCLLPSIKNQEIIITNLSDSELSNHLEIWLTPETSSSTTMQTRDLELEEDNVLKSINFEAGETIYLGRFQGRKDGELILNSDTAIVVYIINGVFEFANRLVEQGDTLFMYGSVQSLDFEALAPESIILIFQPARSEL